MVRGTTQFAIVLLLVSGTGLPALAAVDGPDRATGGATVGVASLNEIDDATNSTNTTDDTTNTTDETTNSTNTTDDTTNTTDDATNTTDDTSNTTKTTDDATNETLSNSTDDATNTTDGTTNATDGTTNSTNETLTNTTDGTTNTTEDATNATNTTHDTSNTTNTTDDATNKSVTNSTGDATNATDELVGTTNGTDDHAGTTDGVSDVTEEAVGTTDEVTDAVDDVANASVVISLSDTSLKVASSTFTVTSLDSSSLVNDTLDSDASGSSSSASSSAPSGSTAQSRAERTDENATETTATGTDERRTTTTATNSMSAEDRTGGRDGIVPEGASEAMVGVSALTAAALAPQLADVLALIGNAGGLLSASTAFVGSTSGRRRGLRSRIDRFWRFVAPFRYSRWDDSDPLDHEIREALYEAIESTPGAYLSEVCDRADVALSTARHHLDVLEDEGLVTTAKVRGKRRYYPDHAPDVELTAALEDEGTAEVLHALASLGVSHGGRLADELDRDPSTVSHHLSRLEDAGLVERERDGRAVVNRLTPEVRAVLRGDGATDGETGGETDAETPAVAD